MITSRWMSWFKLTVWGIGKCTANTHHKEVLQRYCLIKYPNSLGAAMDIITFK